MTALGLLLWVIGAFGKRWNYDHWRALIGYEQSDKWAAFALIEAIGQLLVVAALSYLAWKWLP